MSDDLPCRFYDADDTVISAAAFAAKLNARIAELEHERDQAMRVVAQAVSILSRAEGLAAQLHGPVSGYITEAQVRALATALAPYREGAGE